MILATRRTIVRPIEETSSCGRPLFADSCHPRLQPRASNLAIAIKHESHFVKIGADPADDFQDAGVLLVEVFPMDDAFVVKDTVPQVANLLPANIKLGQVAFGIGRMGEDAGGQMVSKAAAGMEAIEEGGPKTEVQLGHDAIGCDGLAFFREGLLGVAYLVGLPFGDSCHRIIPLCRGETGG